MVMVGVNHGQCFDKPRATKFTTMGNGIYAVAHRLFRSRRIGSHSPWSERCDSGVAVFQRAIGAQKKPSTSRLEVDGPLVDSLVFRMNIQFNRVNHVLRA